jgi:glycosyltransferase involved in cell wall biosynthesis
VAAIALGQAAALAKHARVTLISDAFPADCAFERLVVRMPNTHWLRRLRHVPDELAFVRGARRALQSLSDIDFVLTHAHAAAYLAARPRGVPFGLVVQGDIFERPAGTYDARLTAFYKWVTPRAYRTAAIVFVQSEQFAALARRRGARNVEIMPHGIDLAAIGATAVTSTSRHTPFRILNVGRLAVEKGLDDLLDACALLGFEYELTLVGSGPLEAHLRARASDRVRFPGPQPRSMLGALYAQHDVFCTSAISEPFGMVVLEALACGLPVIGTRVGGIPEMVRDGVNGLLVPSRDARALAGALTRLATDEPLRARLAASARPSVLPRFSWDEIGARILAAIRRMRA